MVIENQEKKIINRIQIQNTQKQKYTPVAAAKEETKTINVQRTIEGQEKSSDYRIGTQLKQKKEPGVSAKDSSNLIDFSFYINQLKYFYELGDSDGTVGLYISSGRENDIRGSEKLRKYYRKAFAKTSNRKFDYVINSIKQDKESAVVIEGEVYLSFSSKKLLRKVDKKIDATFIVLLLKVGKEFKIASFDWKEV